MTVNCFFHMTFASFAVQAEWCSPNEQLLGTCLSPVCLLWDKTTCSVGLLFREKNRLVITRCCYLICLINLRKYLQLFHLVDIWCEGWISYTGIFVLTCKRRRVGLDTLPQCSYTMRHYVMAVHRAYRAFVQGCSRTLVLLQAGRISRPVITWSKMTSVHYFLN